MIFTPITNINEKKDKQFFKELINIYIDFVNKYRKKYNLNDSIKIFDCTDELINIGVIEQKKDITDLKDFLGNKTFQEFIESVCFYKENKNDLKNILYKLSNTERLKLQQKKELANEPTLIDLFCGAGGLSLGFIQNNFKIELANDIEEVCINTYKYNHPDTPSKKIILGDLKKIVDNIDQFVSKDIDVIIGGPPCQGFSSANQQRIIDDPRNQLYKYFLKAVEKIAPKFVVMENVRGMLKVADQVIEDFKKVKSSKNNIDYHYTVSYKLLNSKDFGVAQSRERLIYIAIRNDVVDKKNISPKSLFEEIELNCKKIDGFNLSDALEFIKPLEAQREKNKNEIDSDISGKKIDINEFGNNNGYLSLINMNRSIPFIFNHKARYVSNLNYEIYRRLDPGDDATNEKISDIMPYSHRNHIFKDKYFKLIPDKPCRTITAHLRMDCHSHIHPYQIRSITPREAARIQSFPDDYFFLGAYLKTYMQIGNAVPPLMSRGISSVIKKYL